MTDYLPPIRRQETNIATKTQDLNLNYVKNTNET